MSNQQIDLGARNEGCNAKLFDDGKRQEVPVCMGGVALIGCNNPEQCHPLYGERINDTHSAHIVLTSEDGTRVETIHTVPREPLVPPGRY